MIRRNVLHRVTACLLLLCMAAGVFVPAVAAAPNNLISEQTEEVTQEGLQVCVVRYKNASYSAVIGCLENGTEVKVLSEKKSFYRIDLYDMKGYVAKSQVVQEDGKYYIRCVEGSSETRYLPTVPASEVLDLRSTLRSKALALQGIPFLWGGTSKKGFDCSGFTQYSYRKIGYDLLRTAQEQLQNGVVIAKEDMQCGDLVFFEKTIDNGRIATHIGIYIGNGQMIHSGSSKGVVIVNLSSSYFQKYYLCARRVILTDAQPEINVPLEGITQDINSAYWRESSQTPVESGNFFCPDILPKD